MLLAIDTGNTNTLFAICDMEGSWVFEWRIATNSTRTDWLERARGIPGPVSVRLPDEAFEG